RQDSYADGTTRSTSTRERSPASGSRLLPQDCHHQLERRGIVRNPKPVATGQHQFDGWSSFHLGRLSLHQRELDRRGLLPKPLPPSVESMLLQASSATVCAD